METEDEQYFKFREMPKVVLFVDGNYMISISRALSLKIDMEKLFDHLSKGMFRHRTYWYSALESSLDRSNNAYRFLDRLRYIPRTKVYAGRLSKKPIGHYETALRTDAGTALSVAMVEQAVTKSADVFILIAGDPEYIPAIRAVQRHGGLVHLVYPHQFSDLRAHPELVKIVDERFEMNAEFLQQFEYVQQYEYDDEDEYDLEYLDEEEEDEDTTHSDEKEIESEEPEELEEPEVITD
ncbi:MAG: NYN domain-containing protein [Candidatus Kariarchaeaceae archaeon]|jgi:uncharacterized LabA/DUF88 family protein